MPCYSRLLIAHHFMRKLNHSLRLNKALKIEIKAQSLLQGVPLLLNKYLNRVKQTQNKEIEGTGS